MTLQLTLGKLVAEANPRNVFRVYAELMHGDADSYSTVEFGPFPAGEPSAEMERLLRLLEQLKELNSTDWNGATDSYHKIPGWPDLIGDAWLPDNEHMDDLARYESHHIRFFDEQGQEHEVSYVLT